MTLPVTITGISLTVACVGPFKSSAGNFYFFGVDATTVTTMQAYRSTAPDVSWASIATVAGFVTKIFYISAYQVGDIIHLVVTDGSNSTTMYSKYCTFNMATNVFSTVEVATSSAGTSSSGGNNGVTVRSTGEVVILYPGPAGGGRQRIYYSRRTGVNTWTAGIELDALPAANSSLGGCALGASDTVHFIWTESANSLVWQRALNSANVLQTATSVSTAGQSHMPLSFNVAGTIKFAGVSYGQCYSFDSANSPPITLVSIDAVNGPQASRGFTDGTNLWALYHVGTGGTYVAKSVNNGVSWGTPVLVYAPSTNNSDNDLSKYARTIYTRGSSIVIPFILNELGTLKYNEYVVGTLFKMAKVWSGSAWAQKPVKVWSGSAWVQKGVKTWNGSAWV